LQAYSQKILEKSPREAGVGVGVPTSRRRIFLAHAREDKLQVRKLYFELKAQGLDPWLDEVDLMPGQIWKEEIPKAIRDAGMFLACLSSRSVGKIGYVQNEFRLALSAFGERPPGSIYLVPVRLDDCEAPDLQIPDGGLSLRDIQWVDLWQEGGFDLLVNAIEHALGVAIALREEARTAMAAPQPVVERRAEQEKRDQARQTEANLAPGSLPKHGTIFRDIDAPWCPELVVIAPGEFMMGSTESERQWAAEQGADAKWVENEKPRHLVKIAYPLAVGRYPVTFYEYDHFAQATKRERPHDHDRGRLPMIYVSWEDAKSYLEWLTAQAGQPYRLLSEAEWEYACRAGTITRYWWGDEITPENANYGQNVNKTSEVGKYSPNSFGLYDLHGNVWEWVEDRWNDSYIGAPDDGSAWLAGDDSRRVLRGGSWIALPHELRSAFRGVNWPVVQDGNFSFRVARTFSRSPGSASAPASSATFRTPLVVRSPSRFR
jgi:formylglycine-generating enzyme required for sulfatase activity